MLFRMLNTRVAGVTDVDAHALLEAYFAERAQGFPTAQGVYQPKFPTDEEFTSPRGVFLLVLDDTGSEHTAHTPVGCGGIRRIHNDPDSNDVRYEVKHLWLEASARGQGLGRLLLAELEEYATELGAQQLVLDTNSSLAAAGGLYRSSGYAEIDAYNDNPNANNWFGKRV